MGALIAGHGICTGWHHRPTGIAMERNWVKGSGIVWQRLAGLVGVLPVSRRQLGTGNLYPTWKQLAFTDEREHKPTPGMGALVRSRFSFTWSRTWTHRRLFILLSNGSIISLITPHLARFVAQLINWCGAFFALSQHDGYSVAVSYDLRCVKL